MPDLADNPSLPLTDDERAYVESVRCLNRFAYFVDQFCYVLSGKEDGAEEFGQFQSGDWVRFRLWDAQLEVADLLQHNRLVTILKARQLGMTWLVVAFALWLMRFHPIATVLLFSRRDDEARKILARLTGMYNRLPAWLQSLKVKDTGHELELSNGSSAMCFPTTAGDSYTATLAVCDEFDLVDPPGQERLIGAVKPTIDQGGRMVILSRPDKSRPQSPFKNIYRAAVEGKNAWTPVFLPWSAHPARDRRWYDEQKRESLSRTGALDYLWEQYPTTDVEALAPRSLDKRIPQEWLLKCYRKAEPISFDKLPENSPSIPGLAIYAPPVKGRGYVVSGDPAEGNPTSDDSAATVLDAVTGEEVACLAGKLDPSVFASHLNTIAIYFNHAPVMVERNNHGHAVILWLEEFGEVGLLDGLDDKTGWLSSQRGKAMLYAACADAFRNGEVLIHSFATFTQLASIEGATLRAPEGEHDDRADSVALCCAALAHCRSDGDDGADTVFRG